MGLLSQASVTDAFKKHQWAAASSVVTLDFSVCVLILEFQAVFSTAFSGIKAIFT